MLQQCLHGLCIFPNMVTNTIVYIMSILLFPVCIDFLAILTPVTIFENVHRPCKHYSKNFNTSPHYIYSLSSFSGYISWVTIFGNAHRPCQWHPNIVNNGPYHIYSDFSWFYSYIGLNYHVWKCAQTMLTVNIVNNACPFFFPWFSDYIYINYYIWRCWRLCQQYPTLSMTVDIISICFSWYFMIFWLYSYWLPY